MKENVARQILRVGKPAPNTPLDLAGKLLAIPKWKPDKFRGCNCWSVELDAETYYIRPIGNSRYERVVFVTWTNPRKIIIHHPYIVTLPRREKTKPPENVKEPAASVKNPQHEYAES